MSHLEGTINLHLGDLVKLDVDSFAPVLWDYQEATPEASIKGDGLVMYRARRDLQPVLLSLNPPAICNFAEWIKKKRWDT